MCLAAVENTCTVIVTLDECFTVENGRRSRWSDNAGRVYGSMSHSKSLSISRTNLRQKYLKCTQDHHNGVCMGIQQYETDQCHVIKHKLAVNRVNRNSSVPKMTA